jgi:hypothetical protein
MNIHETGHTITDEQIRELRNLLFQESGNQMTNDTDACGMALIDPDEQRFRDVADVAKSVREMCRARCAEILNARAQETK